MKIKVIKYNGDEYEIDCLWFEFRTNHCTNWIKVKYQDGRIEYIDEVCVIKSLNKAAEADNGKTEVKS